MKYDGKFASRWRTKSPDALCAVLPLISAFQQSSRHQTATGGDHAEHDHILPQRSRHRTKPHRSQQRYQNRQQSDCRHHPADPLSVQEEQQTDGKRSQRVGFFRNVINLKRPLNGKQNVWKYQNGEEKSDSDGREKDV